MKMVECPCCLGVTGCPLCRGDRVVTQAVAAKHLLEYDDGMRSMLAATINEFLAGLK